MITITNIAKNKLLSLIGKDSTSALLYLTGGGCNGFSYKFKILSDENKVNKLDEIYKLDNKKLYICHKSLLYILGTTIDYKERALTCPFLVLLY